MRALVCAIVAAIGLAAHPAFAQADRSAAAFWKTVQATCDATAAKPAKRARPAHRADRDRRVQPLRRPSDRFQRPAVPLRPDRGRARQEDDGGDRPGEPRPSRLVAGDEILAGAVRRRLPRTSSRCAAIATPRPRRTRRRPRRCCGPRAGRLLRAADAASDPATREILREAALRAAVIDTPWSAAFISYVIRQSGVAANAFQFSNAHRAYIYDAFATSAAELTNEAGDRIYRACPVTTTRPRAGRSDLPAARARARRRQRRGGARAHPGGTRRQHRRALGPAHPLRGGRAYRCAGAQDVQHRRQRRSGRHRQEAEPAPRPEVLGRAKGPLRRRRPLDLAAASADAPRARSRADKCSLNDRKWFVLLQLR